jgi:hypothetical protein
MFVIDFMHEFELGVWKSIAQHIVRILYVQGEDVVRKFDQRLVFVLNANHDLQLSLDYEKHLPLGWIPSVACVAMSLFSRSSPHGIMKTYCR